MNIERHFLRKADFASLVVILTLCGAVWAIIKEPMKWDAASKDIEMLKPRVDSLEKQFTDMASRQSAQMTLIIRELDGIHRDMRTGLRMARKMEENDGQ